MKKKDRFVSMNDDWRCWYLQTEDMNKYYENALGRSKTDIDGVDTPIEEK